MVNGWLSFLREKYGEAQVQQALVSLPAEERAPLERSVLDASWYPIEITHSLQKIQSAVAGKRQDAEELGSYIAEYSFSRTYKMFLKEDPISLGKKIAASLDFFYRNVHTFECETTGPRSCIMRFITVDGKPSKATCVSRLGWWKKTLEMAGAKDAKVTHPRCMRIGDSACDFAVEW